MGIALTVWVALAAPLFLALPYDQADITPLKKRLLWGWIAWLVVLLVIAGTF